MEEEGEEGRELRGNESRLGTDYNVSRLLNGRSLRDVTETRVVLRSTEWFEL